MRPTTRIRKDTNMAMTTHVEPGAVGRVTGSRDEGILARTWARIGRGLKRALEHMQTAREREAMRYAAVYLSSLDDKRLAELGFTRAEVAAMPRGHTAI
jgi:hypothetical protein